MNEYEAKKIKKKRKVYKMNLSLSCLVTRKGECVG